MVSANLLFLGIGIVFLQQLQNEEDLRKTPQGHDNASAVQNDVSIVEQTLTLES